MIDIIAGTILFLMLLVVWAALRTAGKTDDEMGLRDD